MCMYVCVFVCVCVCMYVCMYVCVCMYVHVCICIVNKVVTRSQQSYHMNYYTVSVHQILTQGAPVGDFMKGYSSIMDLATL